ncbi:MAG: hypothetical protein IGBAC_1380 [Ignavibacteriae bacterium]|nr:MAG: hypothetical protein IGBAC_1380 [Ignavibacteriota bacterium]
MDKEKYLNSIIKKYQPEQQPEKSETFKQVCSLIKSWAGETLQSINLVGAHSKGTNISTSNDVDLLIILDSKTCFDLKQLYDNLFSFLTIEKYSPFEKEISIGIIHSKTSFDLIVSMRSSENIQFIKIFNRKKNLCINTSITKHIDLIKASGLVQQIILTKIWRDINKLYFPGIYLELSVLDVLRYRKNDSLEKSFLSILDFLSEDFIDTQITDPANSSNVISDILSDEEKLEIAKTASRTRKLANWEEIVW